MLVRIQARSIDEGELISVPAASYLPELCRPELGGKKFFCSCLLLVVLFA